MCLTSFTERGLQKNLPNNSIIINKFNHKLNSELWLNLSMFRLYSRGISIWVEHPLTSLNVAFFLDFWLNLYIRFSTLIQLFMRCRPAFILKELRARGVIKDIFFKIQDLKCMLFHLISFPFEWHLRDNPLHQI